MKKAGIKNILNEFEWIHLKQVNTNNYLTTQDKKPKRTTQIAAAIGSAAFFLFSCVVINSLYSRIIIKTGV